MGAHSLAGKEVENGLVLIEVLDGRWVWMIWDAGGLCRLTATKFRGRFTELLLEYFLPNLRYDLIV
jgi:hypothetical protein